MADTFVPGALGGRADREDVLGHRRQYDRVHPAVRDEHRHLESTHHVVVVDRPRSESGADVRRHDDVPAHGRLEVIV